METETKKAMDLEEEIDIVLTTHNPYTSDKRADNDYKAKSVQPVIDFKKNVLPKDPYDLKYEDMVRQLTEKVNKTQFDLCSIGTQAGKRDLIDAKESIESPPILLFGANASPAEISRAYREHEECGSKRKSTRLWSDINAIFKTEGKRSITLHDSYSLRLCERMLDQNMSGSTLDYAYYDCPKDQHNPSSGSLLPLWHIPTPITGRIMVSSLSWNNHYTDLFAVGFWDVFWAVDTGDGKQNETGIQKETGMVCVCSLKGLSYPERTIQCTSGVRCVRFHPSSHHLLAVALTNGQLIVYDLSRYPKHVKDSKFAKDFHVDSVNEVQWFQDKLWSTASDGKIMSWLFSENGLIPDKVVANLVEPVEKPPEDLLCLTKSIGMTVSVNHQSGVAGTACGCIQEFSLEEDSAHAGFDGHGSCVKVVQWNPFHPDVFLSCGDDFTAKVWERNHKHPLFEFFFLTGVKDVKWAPFSSSLFALVSGDAVVSVFDLAINKMEAIGTYAVAKRKQNINLTQVQFHPTKPLLIVGDDRGSVTIFKLSPNLRSSLKDLHTDKDFESKEKEKMDKIVKVSIIPDDY